MEAIEQMAKLLAAGINVVGTSMVWLVTPHQADDWLRVPLEQACAAGNASLYVNGIDPGYSGDTAVHAALSLVTRAESVTVQEIFDYGNYDDYEYTGTAMGFGSTPEDDSPMAFQPGVITSLFGGLVRNLADHLDVKLDEVRQRYEPWYTTERIECTMTTVEPGQLAAARFAVEGVRDGVPVITVEHINRLTSAAAPALGVPARRAPRRSQGDGGRRATGGSEHPPVPSGARRHRRRVRLHRRSGGQRDRLGVPRPRRPGLGRGHPADRDDSGVDVVR